MAMFYRATDPQFNQERQKWQVVCSVYASNPNDPANPTPVISFQGITIDCTNASPIALKQACTAFAKSVEENRSTQMDDITGKLIDADTGDIVSQP